MIERLRYHFEPKKGWINDPNGLIYFQGKYHAFFQHNPHDVKWDKMYWGHAVSDDLLSWQELPIALYPEMPYENSGGCFSGSAVEKDGMLYILYTSVSEELGQTQSLVTTPDAVHFTRHPNNPLISQRPEGVEKNDFRDPKVSRIGDKWYMVLAGGRQNVGQVYLYRSDDLVSWEYMGVMAEGKEYGPCIECPDFFELDGKFVLMFSTIGPSGNRTRFLVGDFDGEHFTPENLCTPEEGPHLYAPQTFRAPDGRRILIGWIRTRDRKVPAEVDYTGAFSLPRELHVVNGRLVCQPIGQALPLCVEQDPLVQADDQGVRVLDEGGNVLWNWQGEVNSLRILRDTKLIEVFINQGEHVITCWYRD